MIRKSILVLAALLLLLVPLTACPTEEDGNGNGVTPPKDIKIGAVMCLTGALSTMGGLIRDGVVLAVKEINDAGGINGAEVVLYVEDSKTDTVGGLEAVKKLVQVNGVKVIIGPMITGASMAAGPWAYGNGALLFSPSATSPLIADQDWRQSFFRTCPPDVLQGAGMAQLVTEGGYQRVAIMVMDNAYGVGIGNVVAEELAGQVEIVATIEYDENKLDYRTELQIIKDQKPDVVVHCGYASDSQIVFKQALQLGLDTIPWITSEGCYSAQTLEVAEAAKFMAATVIGTGLTAPEGWTPYAEFAAAYEAEFDAEPGVYCDTSYDATMLLLTAIKNVGADDTSAIAAEVLRLAQDYAGASGIITLNEYGDRLSGDFVVWRVVLVDGTYEYETIKVISL